MKRSKQFFVFNIFLFFNLFFPNLSIAQTDFQTDDNELSSLIHKAKTGIVAIGTFHFNTKPTVQFFGTGFVIANGNRIVTNHHVFASIKEKNLLFNFRDPDTC